MNKGQMIRLLFAALAACGGCTDSISGNGGSTATPPVAPNNLAGGLQNSGKEVALSWVDASGDESGFRVEVNTGPFGAPPYAGVFFVGANNPVFVYDTTLPNTTYYFRVYAITGSSQSDPSNVINVTTPDYPLPPFYFTALATGPSSVDVKWYNGSGINGNSVQRSLDGVTWFTFFSNATGPNQVVGAGDSGLAADTVYYYRGFATSPLGTSNPSPVVSARTQSPVSTTTVPSTSGFGIHSSLAFGPSANQNIVSYDEWFASLVITRGGYGGPYTTTTIDTGMGNGFYGCSVATDNGGNVFVASHIYGNDELRFVTNQTGPWVGTTLDSDPGFTVAIYGKEPQIKVSPSDQSIHIIYKLEASQTGDGWIRHRWRANANGSAWNYEDVLGNVPVLNGHSFAIDNAGTLHLIYATQNLGNGAYELRHAWKAGGGWNDEPVAVGGQPDMNSVTVGPSNRLHVSYKDVMSGGVWYATNDSGSWTAEEVHRHTSVNIGRHNSILYFPTASADVHLAYYDVPNGNLWYAGKQGAAGAWNKKLIDSAGDVGRYTSIASDGFDIYISYYLYDSTNPRLKIARNPQD